MQFEWRTDYYFAIPVGFYLDRVKSIYKRFLHNFTNIPQHTTQDLYKVKAQQCLLQPTSSTS